MERSPSAIQSSILRASPLATELADIFDVIPDDFIVDKFQKVTGRGPKGFKARSLFRVFVASYYLNLDSIAQTVREIQNNPALAVACDIIPGHVPSRPTLSRFFKRLSEERDLLQDALATLTDELRRRLPGFGTNIAIDSSTVRTHSNPDRKPVWDDEAGWTAKGYKVGYSQKQWHWGYKLHLAVDADSELPISCYVTPANGADSQNLLPLLERARYRFKWFKPSSVIADKGYDSQANSKAVIEEFRAAPIIAMREMRKGAKKRRPNSQHRVKGLIPRWSVQWANLYKKRTSVERTFGRLKEHRRLERHCFRGLEKITTHCLISVITLQAKAVCQMNAGLNVNDCRRWIA